MFKFQSLSNYSPFEAIHLLRLFFTAQKFLNSSILMPFSASTIFVSPLPHQQNVSLWGLFSTAETKEKIAWGKIMWIGRVGHRGQAIFGQKLLNTQSSAGRCVHESPIPMEWANMLKESKKKKIHWSQIQPLTTPPAGTLMQMGF